VSGKTIAALPPAFSDASTVKFPSAPQTPEMNPIEKSSRRSPLARDGSDEEQRRQQQSRG
jgi:hypothetical protein